MRYVLRQQPLAGRHRKPELRGLEPQQEIHRARPQNRARPRDHEAVGAGPHGVADRLEGRERVVHRRPGTTVATCHELPSGEIDVQLSNGERLVVDHVLLATGYQPNLANIGYLQPLLDRIETSDGFPVLDERFLTSVPGLFMPGFVATHDFGPFFGFVRGCPAAATLIVAALLDAD